MESEISLKSRFSGTTKVMGSSTRSGGPTNRHDLRPRSNKELDTLKLGSDDTDLPSNGGPSGKTSGSGLQTNKNLSHVPCKFFKQGNCLAGSLCPFSHNLDGTLAADKLPCKYFQKGNCKFGLKCALAHFLPDGTRVNSKSLMNNHSNNSSRRTSGNHHGHNHSFSHPSHNTPQPIDISHQLAGNVASYVTLGHKTTSQPTSTTNIASLRNAPSYTGAANWSHNGTNGPFLLSPTSLTTPTYNVASPFSPSNVNNAFKRSLFLVQSPSSTYKYTNSSSTNDFAVFDDEDVYDKYNGVFEEDYVPGTLGDLILTPQEMQRRDSRSQSGTLLVRPHLNFRDDRTIDESILRGDHDRNEDVFLMD